MTATGQARQALPGVMPRVLLGERYRLIRPVDELPGSEGTDTSGGTVLWRAEDETLARPVAARVLVLREGDARVAVLRRQFLDAAVTAGRLSHPCLARVYDAADEGVTLDDGSVGHAAYVVSEWVDGRTLSAALQEGPLSGARAVAVVREVGEGLMAAHDAGIVHARLHPGNVMISSTGQVKVTDTAVAAALAGVSRGSQGTRPDVRDLGRVLYAALTARWPSSTAPSSSDRAGDTGDVPVWGGLPAAPRASTGRPCAPRQVVAGVGKQLDGVVTRTTEPERAGQSGLTTVRAFLAALPEPENLVPAEKTSRRDRGKARVPWWIKGVAALAVIGLVSGVGYVLGVKVGTVPVTDSSKLQSISAGTVQSGSKDPNGPGSQILLTASQITSFDPPPGDGSENPNLISNLVDGSVETPWETETYTTAKLGGIKPGVGFVVDMGSPTPVSNVTLTLGNGVTALQLLSADSAATAISGYTVRAEAGDADTAVTLKLPQTVTARYWVVWLTSLPPAPKGGGFRASVGEVVFRR